MTEQTPTLAALMDELPPELQQQVYDFALFLLQTKTRRSQESGRKVFYLCPVCFQASDWPIECHGHTMIYCQAESIEDCRPLMDAQGRMRTRAPRWFTQAVGRLRTLRG